MGRSKMITRATLAKYAAMLGRNSLAANNLDQYDRLKAMGEKPKIRMNNNDFDILVERDSAYKTS